MSAKTSTAWILTALILIPCAARSQEFPTAETVGHLGGFVNAAAVRGQFAFVCRAKVLAVLDLTAPGLRQLAFLEFPAEPRAIALAGDHAFLTYGNTLEVVDLRDPRNPARVSTTQPAADGKLISGLAPAGDMLYLAVGDALLVVDVSDPAHPAVVATRALAAESISIAGNHAFVAAGGRLTVLDLRQPTSPAEVGSLSLAGAQKVFAEGALAYVFGGVALGLGIVDVSVPANPRLVGSFGVGTTFDQVFAAAGRAYFIAAGRFGILDVSRPASPAELGALTLSSFGFGASIQVLADTAFFAFRGRLHVADVADAARPVLRQGAEMPEEVRDLAIDRSTLYLASPEALWRYSLADPENPVLEGVFHRPGRPIIRLFAAAQLLYTIDFDGALGITDFSNPAQPEARGTYLPGGLITELHVAGDVAYLLRVAGGIEVVDARDSSRPIKLGELPLPGLGRDLFVDPIRNLLYAAFADPAGGSDQLAIVDVANPAVPSLASTVPLGALPMAVWAADETVFVAGNRGDPASGLLAAFDIADSRDPRPAGDITMGALWDVEAVSGGLVLASVPEASLHLFGFAAGGFTRGPVHPLPKSRDISTYDQGDVLFNYSISGFGYEGIPQETLGSEGVYVTRLFRGQREKTVLTLSASPVPELFCPEEIGDSVAMASFNVCVDDNDDWYVQSFALKAFGAGDDRSHVAATELEVRGRKITAAYAADDGTVRFEIGELVKRGTCLPMHLFYRFDRAALRCPLRPVKDFGVITSVTELAATPETLNQFEKQPPPPFVLSGAAVACIQNVSKDLGFPLLQTAIDDPRTTAGDFIAICPGLYPETAVVSKSLTVRSTAGAAVTTLAGDPSRDVLSVVADGSRIEGLTLTGGANGVAIRNAAEVVIGGGGELRRNVLSGNAGHGALITGAAARGNRLIDNFIGTAADGLSARANGGDGVRVEGAPTTVIEQNFVTANRGSGVVVEGPGADETSVRANVLGSDVEPPSPALSARRAAGRAKEGKTFEGNAEHGLLIRNQTLQPVQGNKIIRNRKDGIRIEDASNNVIGEVRDAALPADPAQAESCAGNCNLITGNGGSGVAIDGKTVARRNKSLSNTVRGNRIFDNQGLGINLGGSADLSDGVTPNDMLVPRTSGGQLPKPPDHDLGPNNLMNFPAALTYKRELNVLTGVLDTEPDRFPVVLDFYLDDQLQTTEVGAGRESHTAEGERYLGSLRFERPPAIKDFMGLDNFKLKLPAPPPPGRFLTAIVTDKDGNTSEFAPVSCRNARQNDRRPDDFDNDGDGVCDSWEEVGIDYDGDGSIDLDLRTLDQDSPADPDHKDLFVEIDFSDCKVPDGVCIDSDSGRPLPADHNDQPQTGAMADVEQAFASAPVDNPDGKPGIRLHTFIDDAVPHDKNRVISQVVGVKFGRDPRLGGGLLHPCERIALDNKELGFFGTASDRESNKCPQILGAKLLIFRYAVFGHEHGQGGTGGEAELGGDDFIVAIGARGTEMLLTQAGIAQQGRRADGERHVQASVFMHELGHALNLRHGGQDDVNCKPNYLSVMNYAYTHRDFARNRPLDYSRSKFKTLNEIELDETKGLELVTSSRGFDVKKWNVVYSFGRTRAFAAPGNPFPSADAPVNWGGRPDRIDTDPVAADINIVAHTGTSPLRCDNFNKGQNLIVTRDSRLTPRANGDFELENDLLGDYYFSPEEEKDPSLRPKLVGRAIKILGFVQGQANEVILDSGIITAHSGDKVVVSGLRENPPPDSFWLFEERHESFEDWPAIRYSFRESDRYGKLFQGAGTFEEPLRDEDVREEAKARDFDGDGVSDFDDNCPADLNPSQADTDGDGYGDGCDTCPLVPNLIFDDADGDGIGDACDAGGPTAQEIPTLSEWSLWLLCCLLLGLGLRFLQHRAPSLGGGAGC